METKGIIISQKEYERLTELEKNFDDKVKKYKESFKAKKIKYQEVIADQRKTIRYLWWAFAIMSMTWLVRLITYAMK